MLELEGAAAHPADHSSFWRQKYFTLILVGNMIIDPAVLEK